MKREKISETIQNISSKHVDEATVYNGGKMIKSRKIWITLAAVAACLILCVSLFLSIGREYVNREPHQTQSYLQHITLCFPPTAQVL